MEIVQIKIVRFVVNINNIETTLYLWVLLVQNRYVSTYSFSFPSNDFSIHGIYPDERQLLDGLRRIILTSQSKS
jgi:hypothetical protein